MKTLKLALILFLFCISNLILAQRPQEGMGGKKEMIESLRVGIYTKVLKLTVKEAQIFWPLFNESQEKQEEIRKSIKKEKMVIMHDYNTLTDKDIDKVMKRIFAYEQQELDLKIKYTEKFMEIIPIKKVVLMQKAERMFHKALLDKVRNNRPHQQNKW